MAGENAGFMRCSCNAKWSNLGQATVYHLHPAEAKGTFQAMPQCAAEKGFADWEWELQMRNRQPGDAEAAVAQG
jgi:hypothetical protein